MGLLFANMGFLTIFYYVGWNALRSTLGKILLHVTYYSLSTTYVVLTVYCCIAFRKNQDIPYKCTGTYFLVQKDIIFR